MSGAVLYRKWRPLDFDQVVGQEPVVRTLRNAVAQDKIAHAYLFCGPRGTGKTTTARILARAINGQTAVGEASLLGDGDGLGFDLIEIDAASNRGIDDIRELRERANYQPGSARFKVYLIDEVHQLTDAANDALLKTLEEPPPHVIFILATTDPEKLKATILSRCQRFDFRRVSVDDMVGRLREIADAEGITIPDEALRLISREATGSLRDAVNLLDQVWTTCGDDVSVEAAQEALGLSPDARALALASAALKRDLKAGLAVLGAVQSDAIDFQRFKRQVVTHLRHVLLMLTGAAETLALSEPETQSLREVCEGVEAPAAVAALRAFSDADVRTDPYQPLPLELALASIVYGSAPDQSTAPRPDAATSARERREQPQRSQRPQSQRSNQQRRPSEQPRRRDRAPATAQPQPEAAQPTERAVQASASDRRDADLDGLLNEIIGTLFSRDKIVALALRDACRIPTPPTEELILEFLAGREGNMKRCEEALSLLSEVAQRVLKRPVQVRCVLGKRSAGSTQDQANVSRTSNGNGTNRAPATAVQSESPPQSLMVQEARRRFGAQPVKT